MVSRKLTGIEDSAYVTTCYLIYYCPRVNQSLCTIKNRFSRTYILCSFWKEAIKIIYRFFFWFFICFKIVCYFFSKLMEKLIENKRYSEALELLSYSNNATTEELLSCALQGQMYRKALNICKRFKRNDLIGRFIYNIIFYMSCGTLAL